MKRSLVPLAFLAFLFSFLPSIAEAAKPSVTISATQPTATEAGPTNGQFTIQLSEPAASNLSVNFSVKGTATQGSDYTSIGTSVTIPTGLSSAVVMVTPVNDTAVEPNETVVVTISKKAYYTVDLARSATVTIISDDPAVSSAGTVQFKSPTSTAAENGGSVQLCASRTGGSYGGASVSYATANGTAQSGSDYTAAGGTLAWVSGETADKCFNVTILNDASYEGSETFTANLSGASGASLGGPSTMTVTIADDDPAPTAGTVQFKSPTSTTAENGGSVQLCVSRTGGSYGAASVSYATANGTAQSGSDYTAAGGTLNWVSGETADKCFNVTILNDAIYEGSETFTANLSGASGASLGGTSTMTVTIADDDPAISSISPSTGPTTGGTPVTITGSNLSGTTGVTFGGTAASSVAVVDATHVTCVTPARGAGGTVSVVLSTPGGTASASYIYDEPPAVTTFSVPSSVTTQTVPVQALVATDDHGVTGYLINESSGKPSAGAAGWSAVAPSSYVAQSTGLRTLYAWAKDAVGSVSASRSASVNIVPQSGSGNTVWAQRLGSSGVDEGWAVAVDHQGNAIVTGGFTGTVDFGDGPLVGSTRVTSVFVAKFTEAGGLLWSKAFPSGMYGASRGTGVVVDSYDNIIITGVFSEYIDLGGGRLSGLYAMSPVDAFIAKFSPAGDHVWSKAFGNYPYGVTMQAAVDSGNNVVATGVFSGTVDFGGGPLTSAGPRDIFLVKYSPSGSHFWSKRLGGTGSDGGKAIAVDSGSNIVVTGYFEGNVTFGGGLIANAGGMDAFVAKFSPAGSHLWSRGFGGSSNDNGLSVALDNGGNVFVTGCFQGTADFGGGPLASAGYEDVFAAKFSSVGGHVWSKRFGGPGSDLGLSAAVDTGGNVLLTGGYQQGAIDFGGGPLLSSYFYGNIFAAKLSPTGGHVWSRGFGSPYATQVARSLSTDANGNAFVTGYIEGTVDLGAGSLTSAGASDVFLLNLAP